MKLPRKQNKINWNQKQLETCQIETYVHPDITNRANTIETRNSTTIYFPKYFISTDILAFIFAINASAISLSLQAIAKLSTFRKKRIFFLQYTHSTDKARAKWQSDRYRLLVCCWLSRPKAVHSLGGPVMLFVLVALHSLPIRVCLLISTIPDIVCQPLCIMVPLGVGLLQRHLRHLHWKLEGSKLLMLLKISDFHFGQDCLQMSSPMWLILFGLVLHYICTMISFSRHLRTANT